MSLHNTTNAESELISLITELINPQGSTYLYGFLYPQPSKDIISLIIQIISVVRSVDLDSQPKPESKLMSLVKQTISLFNSMDMDSQPKPLLELISLTISILNSNDPDLRWKLDSEFDSLVTQTLELKTEPELISLIHQIFSLVISMNSNWEKLISLSPQVQVGLFDGKFRVIKELPWRSNHKWNCFLGRLEKFRLAGEDAAQSYNGEYHREYEKAPVEVKHPLHPQHYLQLVFQLRSENRKCYCCDENLTEVFYYCLACDYAMHIACVQKPRDLCINHPEWHEHSLALFSRQTPLNCNLCSLADLSSPIYMCPPCGFVVHRRCISLPNVIRISRHPHRIRYTPSFDEGDWSCGICRTKIDTDYGGYSCIKKDCSYAAHSRCATRSNVWDGIELEGEPEEIEEVAEPFVSISDGIIQHISHKHHHLRLDGNTCRDYDENKQCQACITPIYFGNFYSCVQCEFVLHETCANLSLKIYHPIHPHMLTLAPVGRNRNVMHHANRCSACYRLFTAGFLYMCGKEECPFLLHVWCATVSEPLDHASHEHHLFLTSKPEERRMCRVCISASSLYTNETFNCIECECDFSMCFKCAVLPQKARDKHDKHMLTLSYGKETSTMIYWCEVCEEKIMPSEGFYMCNEYCCVTLHIKCLIGRDLYMKPGSSSFYYGEKVHVLPNNQHMSRPICFKCEKRCPQKIVFQCSGSIILCSVSCFLDFSNIQTIYF